MKQAPFFGAIFCIAACGSSGVGETNGATGGTANGIATGGKQIAGMGGSTGGRASNSAGGRGNTGGDDGTPSGGAAGSSSEGDGGNSTGSNSSSGGQGSLGGSVKLPPENASFDYQIGGAYTPPTGVQIVSRDRESESAPGLYNICYVNGFQTQPQDNATWLKDNPDLVLHDKDGVPVEDANWGEYLLDTSSAEKRAGLLAIVKPWISGCKERGFDAIEVDNLDSYSRSGKLLTEDNNVAFLNLLADFAHAQGLAVGQKNSSELLSRKSEMGTDFAVAEECNTWDECGDYQSAYGNRVYVIEYVEADFDKGCSAFPELSIVLRDLDVTTPGSSSYVYEGC